METNISLTAVIFIVGGLIGLNALSYYSQKVKILPDIIWILILGVIYGFLSKDFKGLTLPTVELNESVIFYIFVPVLIFASTQKICLAHFRKVLVPAALIASFGILISMLLIALALHLFFSVPILLGLLFGVIVSATDPLAIGALLSNNKNIDESRKLLIEGESILNDGFVVTIFSILFALIYEGEVFNLEASSISLITHIIGALLVGSILGRLARKLLKIWDGQSFSLQMNMTLALAFGSFVLTESLHFSGVLGVFAAALSYGYKPNTDDPNMDTLENLWQYLEYIANACLFFLLGASVSTLASFANLELIYIVFAVVFVFVARFISLLVLWPVTTIEGKRLTKNEFWLMNFAGARGAISIALILLLPAGSEYKDFFLTLAFIMIIFTLLVYPVLMQAILKNK